MSSSGVHFSIHLNPRDNIRIATRTIDEGAVIDHLGGQIEARDTIGLGHKVAIEAIDNGQPVYKYGQIIGFATQRIEPGQWVHSHNLANGDLHLDYAPATQIPPPPEPITGRTFNGYQRAGGKAGTRNYVGIISSVNCSATVSKTIARKFEGDALAAYPNIDGVAAFTHDTGCGMQYASQKHDMLNRVLGGIAKHPNIGAYLLIGLGCEQASLGYLMQQQNLIQIGGQTTAVADGVMTGGDGAPLVFSMQDMGGTVKSVEAGVKAVAELLPRANDVTRQPLPISQLILGTECGGSDGNSGITANPAVGVAADMLVAAGGTSILAETSEIYGAEHLLTRRAVSTTVAEKLLARIEWWKWYVGLYGAELDNNPSVGNKAGGLTTIAEKSLGAVAKAGSTALVDVYEYAEPVTAKGLVVMDTPGYDPPSVTGMVAGGANVVVFTTGRGSCFGCKPTPVIKIASNTPMYERMSDDMDINTGEILNGQTVQDAGREIFEKIIATASGEPTRSEAHGMGDDEFIPWTVGPTL